MMTVSIRTQSGSKSDHTAFKSHFMLFMPLRNPASNLWVVSTPSQRRYKQQHDKTYLSHTRTSAGGNLLPFSCFHPVNIQTPSSQGAAGCQICSRRACSKMHVQPLRQEVDVPVRRKSSLRQQVYLTWYFMDDCYASHLSEL